MVFIKALMDGNLEDAKSKLKIVTQGQLADYKIFSDNFKQAVPDQLRVGKKMMNKLWLHFVRKEKIMKTKDFVELFPYRKEELEIWEEFIGEDG